jgi:6-phosphogluconolactonase
MEPSTEVRIYPKPKKTCKKVAQEIMKYISEWPKPRYDVALSGGSTPKKLFKVLSKKHRDTIPWDKVHFWWVDERCVSPENDESNFKMAKDNLLSKIAIPERNIHRIKGENQPKAEALLYAAEISDNLKSKNSIPVFDIIWVRMDILHPSFLVSCTCSGKKNYVLFPVILRRGSKELHLQERF